MPYVPLILVAEDNDMNRELIREILEDEGYRVEEAVNGRAAVEKAAVEIPDLVLMDIEMPEMNGLEATRILKEKPATSRVPVIVLTGLNETEDRIKAFNCGAMDYLAKPFDTHELLARVKSYIRFSLLNKKYVLSTINQETGIPNRAAFREKLPELQAPKLFLVKIDNIEAISRFYGEMIGTEIEKSFSSFLIREQLLKIKAYSEIFHLGRGLFGFLLEDQDNHIDKSKARDIAKEMLNRLTHRQMTIKDVQYDIEVTIVIGFNQKNMLEKSELALDEAIRHKTGIILVEDIIEDVYHTIGENIFWLKKIKEAVQENRMLLYYQPILTNATGKVQKYEALLRMIDEQGRVISPGQFLFIAKNSKYYPDITKIVMRQAMELFEHRVEEFSINLSALDIENKSMRLFLLDSLQEAPNVASRLTFEIVEQEGVKHIDVLKDFVREVKRYGAKIAIDDFGSGYSNFRTLLDMDVDFLKIDGSLIRNISTDISSRNVVETVKTFADKTGIHIIAEFVENEAIFQCLKKIGIQYSQGYYIGKPQPL
jgi:EAL domain-containing protein (putative c-di-GMP-specific phosphodiesterase class I)/CheY-like chemotaxis protein